MIGSLLAALRDGVRRTRGGSYTRRLPPLSDSRPGDYLSADGIHPTAVVSPAAELAPDVTIGPFTVVEGQTSIGAGTQIGAHCMIKRFTQIGTGNRVYEGVVIGQDPQDVGFRGEESRVVIGDDNVIREAVTINRATGSGNATIIGSRNYFMAYVHVAHNCVVGDRVGLVNNATLAGHSRVENDVYMSALSAIDVRVRIGRGAMVSSLTRVMKDVLPFCMADGRPAGLVGLNMQGLRAAGIHGSQISNLKQAYRLLATRGEMVEESLETLSRLNDPLVDELIAFVRSSTKGFCRARRHSSQPPPSPGMERG